jgi:hypothetical protein
MPVGDYPFEPHANAASRKGLISILVCAYIYTQT